jgi:hypothetical protein
MADINGPLFAQTGDLIDTRWDMAATEVRRFEGEDYPSAEHNSEQIEAVRDALEELAVRLVGSVGRTETEGLDAVRDGIMDEIERRLKAWAIQVEVARLTGAQVSAA